MQPRTFLLGLLGIAFTAAFYAAMLANARSEPHVGSITTSIAIGAGFGVLSVICIWSVVGNANLVIRTCGSLATIGILSVIAACLEMRLEPRSAAAVSWERIQVWLGFLALTGLTMTMPAMVQRIAQVSGRWQTTLAQLFSLTTAVALSLGALQHARWPALGPARLATLCAAAAVPSWIAYMTWRTDRGLFASATAYLASGAMMAAILELLQIPGGRISSIGAAVCECLVLGIGYAVILATPKSAGSHCKPTLRVMTAE
jgi:hypothetical protein